MGFRCGTFRSEIPRADAPAQTHSTPVDSRRLLPIRFRSTLTRRAVASTIKLDLSRYMETGEFTFTYPLWYPFDDCPAIFSVDIGDYNWNRE